MSKIGNYVVGQDEELYRIASSWSDAFDITRAIRSEIKDSEARLLVADAIFDDIHLEWLAYEAMEQVK